MPLIGSMANPGNGQSGLLRAGLKADFRDTYRFSYKTMLARLRSMMTIDVASDKRTEFYAYMLTAPYIRRWAQGDAIAQGGVGTVQFHVTNLRYGIRVQWYKDDAADDQIGAIEQKVREAGEQAATLDERIFYQIMQGTTDPDLLPAVPNAPDGAALYSTTHGDSTNRFQTSGGNIITGTSNPTAQDIRGFYQQALARWASFKDTEGQPLLPPDVQDGGVVMIYGTELTQQMKEAFVQSRTAERDTSLASGAMAAVSNVVLDSGEKVILQRSQRVSNTNDIYCFLADSKLKPIFRQTREPIKELIGNEGNSDFTRDYLAEYLQWSGRFGYGVNLPYGTIKINNS